MSPSAIPRVPETQTAAIVRNIGGEVEFLDDYPVPAPKKNEVLAKILYTGVCQSDLDTMSGTAMKADGTPITKIKLPHVGGHEGIGQVVAVGDECGDGIKLGGLVGIRFASRICRRCEYCLAGKEQYCIKSTNHLHHEDGSFQQYIALDADYLTILPDDLDPKLAGPVLCAGLTAYKACLNATIKAGDWVVVMGAGGGLGHLAVQYARAMSAQVIGVDGGINKKEFVLSIGAKEYVDFTRSSDVVQDVMEITNGGASAVVVAVGNPRAFTQGANMLRIEGRLCCVGIPAGKVFIEIPIAHIVLKGIKITGNLVGSLKECLEAVELVRRGIVKPQVTVRPFKDLGKVYEELEKGQISGRVVLKIA